MQIKELNELYEAFEREMKAYDELLEYYNHANDDYNSDLYKRLIKDYAS